MERPVSHTRLLPFSQTHKSYGLCSKQPLYWSTFQLATLTSKGLLPGNTTMTLAGHSCDCMAGMKQTAGWSTIHFWRFQTFSWGTLDTVVLAFAYGGHDNRSRDWVVGSVDKGIALQVWGLEPSRSQVGMTASCSFSTPEAETKILRADWLARPAAICDRGSVRERKKKEIKDDTWG